jgi:hypothetical protein
LYHYRGKMLNPWFSFSIQAVKLGLETQSLVVERLLRVGIAPLNRKAASVTETPHTASPEEDPSPVQSATSAVVARAQAASNKPPQVKQKVHQKRRVEGKRVRGKRSR